MGLRRTYFQNIQIEQFIFFTGDGHFSSVATFLRNYMDKTVGVYGTSRSLSRQLGDCCSWIKLIKVADENDYTYRERLLHVLKDAENKGIYSTFAKTAEYASKISYDSTNLARYERALTALIENEYIKRTSCVSDYGKNFFMLTVDWNKVTRDALL